MRHMTKLTSSFLNTSVFHLLTYTSLWGAGSHSSVFLNVYLHVCESPHKWRLMRWVNLHRRVGGIIWV